MKNNVFCVTILVFTMLITKAWCFSPPESKITVRVVDENGVVMEGMPVRVNFKIPHPRKRGIGVNKVNAFTDSRGTFSAQSELDDSGVGPRQVVES